MTEEALVKSSLPVEMADALCPIMRDQAVWDEMIVRNDVCTQVAQVAEHERLEIFPVLSGREQKLAGHCPAVTMITFRC